MITVGTDEEDWEVYARMAESRPGTIDYTVGIHPTGWTTTGKLLKAAFVPISSVRIHPSLSAKSAWIDFIYPKTQQEAEKKLQCQKDAFREQLEIAKSLAATVVIHSRGAFAECVEEIDRSGVDWSRVVFHCFSEGSGEMQQLIDGVATVALRESSPSRMRSQLEMRPDCRVLIGL